MVSIYFSEIVLALVYFLSLYFTVFWLLTFLEKTEVKRKKWKVLPSVSVLIPAYNEEDSIKETVMSVVNLNYPKDKLKIYVINDGSKDKTKDIAEDLTKKYKNVFLINQINGGKANALNNALKLIDSDFTATLDADSFVTKDTLKILLTYFAENNIAAVLPAMKIRNPKNTLQGMQRLEYNLNLFYRMMNEKLNCIHVTPGPFPLYQTSVLKELNGFDEKCITEDLELAIRIQRLNYRILQTYEAEVFTIPPHTIKGLYNQRKRWYKGGLLACIKHKDLMFSRKYGDFGFIRMPSMIILPLLSITAFVTVLNDLKNSIVRNIQNFSSIDFDFTPIIKTYEFNYNFLDIRFVNFYMGIFLILLSLVLLYYAHRYANEKMSQYGKTTKSLAYYMFIHPFFIVFVFLVVAYSTVFDKKYSWYSAGKRIK